MTATSPDRLTPDRVFFRSLLITTLIRAVLAALVPLTGDEAYFVLWGEFPDLGYYDHTPMAGWWLAAMLLVGKSAWLMRLPALLTTIVVALLIWRVVRERDADKAGWIGALYLWSPHNVVNFFTTTDTPVLLFGVIAGLFTYRAVRADRAFDYLLAGVFIGLAFLAKYFAVLLGVGMAVLLLGFAGRPRWGGLMLILLGAAPSIAVNVYWNYQHGWPNILFNLYNRTRDAGFSLANPLVFVAISVLPLGPVAWQVLKPQAEGRLSWREAWRGWRADGTLAFVLCFAVPMALLLLVSLQKTVGAHWVLGFFPFFFIALAGLFSTDALRRMLRPMVLFGGSLCTVGAVAVLLPVELMRGHKSYDSVVLGTHMEDVLAALEPYRAEYVLTTPSYTKSAMLSFYGGRYVPVLGPGSYHGRQDDFLTDWRAFDGKKLMVLCDTPARVAASRAWFDRSEVHTVDVRGAAFSIVLGDGFQFGTYRDTVLEPRVARYHRMPAWLARWSKPSPFLERYGLPADAAAAVDRE
ncbi:MAG: glycosyltransferase family 39 protein [Opitutaceae bacterium]|nr:glycosyltransferase family 39 protein [Opitutaceae bacterium]